ncbi:probably inactive receptor-like protein kinase At2g46850 [Silene latifolia]|uniref:probably inactive receptor-like protein kinase At2g46850 n=1 Tax=Silene latifolia TaxID=37657 RepID=UPI003D77FF05
MPSLINTLFFTFVLTFTSFTQFHAKPITNLTQKSQINPKCNETCGDFQVSYPFYINNASCGWSNTFQLSCLNSTSLFLNIDSQNYRILEFFSDGILLNFPGFSNTCRPYNDLNSFKFNANNFNNFLGISNDNIIGLYDCEDSSLCKTNCEANNLPNCDRNGNNNNVNGPTCCYPLSDHSVWYKGSDFDVFSKYECRGFSSWVVPRGMKVGKRGVKLEWAIPMNLSNNGVVICDVNAQMINATNVKDGIRCFCDDGFVGDGYVNGTGCLKACFKDGKEKFGEDCEPDRNPKKKIIILAVLTSTLAAVFLLTLVCLIKRSVKPSVYGSSDNQPHFRSTFSFRKSCNTRLFTLKELNEATNGFDQGHGGPVYKGTLKDGSGIAVQRIQCQNEQDLMNVLSRIELLSSIIHRQLAHVFGCCIDSGYAPMVIYEFPENGSLDEHLQKGKDEKIGLDWYKRLSIAAQTASVLAFLQHEISPPVFHHDLKTSSIFLDQECNVKIACFAMLEGSNLYRSDVYDFGVVLLELISGSSHTDLPTVGIQKIRDGKIEEMADPLLYYHEQPPFRKEQIEMVADIATRCLIFGGEGKFRMVDVARELVHIMKESIDGGSKRGPALEETFSNSSLLQMISMSPDSIYLPSKV